MEWGAFPEELTRVFVVPLDKAGKDPARCLRSASRQSDGTSLPARETHGVNFSSKNVPVAGGTSDRESVRVPTRTQHRNIVGKNIRDGHTPYVVGLDIEGAFDNASLPRLVETLENRDVPKIIRSLIGYWIARRSFRIKLGTHMGGHVEPAKSPVASGLVATPVELTH